MANDHPLPKKGEESREDQVQKKTCCAVEPTGNGYVDPFSTGQVPNLLDQYFMVQRGHGDVLQAALDYQEEEPVNISVSRQRIDNGLQVTHDVSGKALKSAKVKDCTAKTRFSFQMVFHFLG